MYTNPNGQRPVVPSSPAATNTAAGTVPTPSTDADTAERLAKAFKTSAFPWRAHLPEGTTVPTTTTTAATTAATTTTTSTTTTTTTSTSTVATTATLSSVANSSNSSNSSSSVEPLWHERLEGLPRGDECFRIRYGTGVSLLTDEGRTDMRFIADPGRCHPVFRGVAETLGGVMQSRNLAVEALSKAKAQLGGAEAAVDRAKKQLELAQRAAQRDGQPLNQQMFGDLEVALAEAKQLRDLAKDACADCEERLKTAQKTLLRTHAEASKLTSQTDDQLKSEAYRIAELRAIRAMNESSPQGMIVIPPRGLFLTACALVGGLIAANARPLENTIEILRAELGSSVTATILGAILDAAGIAPHRHGAQGVQAAGDHSASHEVAFGLIVGLLFAYALVLTKRA
ncbi:hypothetical protein [Hydrogenophaga sp.]|uniref:hypothetical protein n=1 Tax=Hydrogenophaga sp. TaxID=1904254 RepID=UPI0027219690|nr:hypothetical protein [Hydrogenophaga sp.]MDO9436751.1 hypothetical protein [Hydrogenophaga sp.]